MLREIFSPLCIQRPLILHCTLSIMKAQRRPKAFTKLKVSNYLSVAMAAETERYRAPALICILTTIPKWITIWYKWNRETFSSSSELTLCMIICEFPKLCFNLLGNSGIPLLKLVGSSLRRQLPHKQVRPAPRPAQRPAPPPRLATRLVVAITKLLVYRLLSEQHTTKLFARSTSCTADFSFQRAGYVHARAVSIALIPHVN